MGKGKSIPGLQTGSNVHQGEQKLHYTRFFAADGNAAETSAESGNVWKVRFRPDESGEWQYKISFRKGKDIVVKEGENGGEAVGPDGWKERLPLNHRIKQGLISGQKGES